MQLQINPVILLNAPQVVQPPQESWMIFSAGELDAAAEEDDLQICLARNSVKLADFGKVIELDPRYAKAYANRGMILLLRRQDTEAKRDFATALELDSSLKAALEKSVDQIVKVRRPQP